MNWSVIIFASRITHTLAHYSKRTHTRIHLAVAQVEHTMPSRCTEQIDERDPARLFLPNSPVIRRERGRQREVKRTQRRQK